MTREQRWSSRCAVTVWKFDGRGIDCGEHAARWVPQFPETPLRLVRFDASAPRDVQSDWTPGTRAITEFSDGFPMLVISRASLADLNSRLPQALPMERFRPERGHRRRRRLRRRPHPRIARRSRDACAS